MWTKEEYIKSFKKDQEHFLTHENLGGMFWESVFLGVENAIETQAFNSREEIYDMFPQLFAHVKNK